MNEAWNCQGHKKILGVSLQIIFPLDDFQGQRRQEGGEVGKSKEVTLGEVELSNKVRFKMSRESGRREGLLTCCLLLKELSEFEENYLSETLHFIVFYDQSQRTGDSLDIHIIRLFREHPLPAFKVIAMLMIHWIICFIHPANQLTNIILLYSKICIGCQKCFWGFCLVWYNTDLQWMCNNDEDTCNSN